MTNIDKFDIAAFEQRYGIRIGQFLDFKSLKGDASDNIPGVPGVGEKTAVKLLQQFDTLDNLYDNLWQVKDTLRRKLEQGKESAYMSRELARLYTNAPVTLDRAAMAMDNCDPAAVRAMLQRLEFRSLLRHLPPQMQATESTQSPDAPVVQYATELPAHQAKALFLMAQELLVWPVEGGVW